MEILENEKNLTIIENEGQIVLFSYNSKIATFYKGTKSQWLGLTDKWDYSQTTLKHLKHFINNYTCYNYESKKDFLNLMDQLQNNFKNNHYRFIYIENGKN